MLFKALVVLGTAYQAHACSRVTYHASEDRITIGRSVDFVADTNTTVYAWPAGLERNGGVEDYPFNWTSKYGSVTALMYDKAYTEGVNSEGLAGSTLYLGDSQFEERNATRPGMFVGIWMQYFLDTYANVADAAKAYCPGPGEEPFQVVVKSIVPGVHSNLHLSFSDPTGNNLIMEFAKGKLTCWESKNYTVMTNEPTFDQQLAIDAYWGPVANHSLPGTARPADRFARLSYYNKNIPPAKDAAEAVSYCAGMVRAVSNPMLLTSFETAGAADVWPTYWRMYTDLKDMMMFYESASSPSLFWMDVNELLSDKNQTKVLSLKGVPWQDRMADMTKEFQNASKEACQAIWTQC
ncbi:hypothetical protein NLU13_4435 [Sarocladium strictum]|uniref:Choloylglycine hydrolase/NAAA C-terminal domain-containing protein n=1 Tax=Sarocladium strictum TaxID=5046 RepID=A0AA39L8T8_SARSR|nr:hypothetical protein NLU13_4435 [Sarocladium strictum]